MKSMSTTEVRVSSELGHDLIQVSPAEGWTPLTEINVTRFQEGHEPPMGILQDWKMAWRTEHEMMEIIEHEGRVVRMKLTLVLDPVRSELS